MVDRSGTCSISLYKSQTDKIQKYKENHKNFKSDAAVYQYIIDTFFENLQKKSKHFIFLYIIYPVILCTLTWFGAQQTQNLVNILLTKDMYFNELYILNRVFTILSFGALSWLIANIYILMYYKREGKLG